MSFSSLMLRLNCGSIQFDYTLDTSRKPMGVFLNLCRPITVDCIYLLIGRRAAVRAPDERAVAEDLHLQVRGSVRIASDERVVSVEEQRTVLVRNQSHHGCHFSHFGERPRIEVTRDMTLRRAFSSRDRYMNQRYCESIPSVSSSMAKRSCFK